MSNNKKPMVNHIAQQAAAMAQMQAAAAQQQASFYGAMVSSNPQHNTILGQQQQYNSAASQLSMQQMQAAFNQMAQMSGIHNTYQAAYPPEAKYSTAELKMAIGTTVYLGDDKYTLEQVVDEVSLKVSTGILFKSYRDTRSWYITKIPMIDKMYKTKLGRICKS